MECKSNALKRESHSHENAQFNRVHVDLRLCRDQGRSHRHRQLGSPVGHSLAIGRAPARAAPAHARPNIAAALRCSAQQASRRRRRRHAFLRASRRSHGGRHKWRHGARAFVIVPAMSAHRRSRQKPKKVGACGGSLNLTLQKLVARRPRELEGAFAAIGSDRPDVLLVTTNALSFPNRGIIVELALKNRLPAMSAFREITEVGGLMSYGSVRVDRFRRAALYVAKILQGARPADLPVEQPSKYELVINLKTARSLNLEIPCDLLLVADEVIE